MLSLQASIRQRMVPVSENLDWTCPVCNQPKMQVRSEIYTVPFFNQLAMFMLRCSACGFTHNDIFSTEERTPCRWTLYVNRPEMLNIRVVRSSSGTIRMPEFGIDIEPGPAAESFISNVEGILLRTRPIIESAINFAENDEQRARGHEVLNLIDRASAGEIPFTLILEDPVGISGILPDDMTLVKYEELTPEEAANLRGAPTWMTILREKYAERNG